MDKKHPITLELPEELFEQLQEYKKTTDLPDDESVVIELLRHALCLPPYFKEFDWSKAERQADDDIKEGRTKSFSSAEDLVNDLYE